MASKSIGQYTEETSLIAGDEFLLQRSGQYKKIKKENAFPSTSISKTYSDASTLRTNSQLQEGFWYFISDRDIYIRATASNAFALEGVIILRNPDFANVSTNFIGIWHSGLTPSVNELVAYDNYMWKNLTNNVGTAPSGDAVNWEIVSTKTYSSGTWKNWSGKTNSDYVIEYAQVEYDFPNDWVQTIRDRHGNEVGTSKNYEDTNSFGFNMIEKFRWGHNIVISNKVKEARFDIVNWRGQVISCKLEPFAEVYNITGGDGSTSLLSDIELSSLSKLHDITYPGTGGDIFSVNIHAGAEVANKTLSNSVSIQDFTISQDWNNTETLSFSFSSANITLSIQTGVTAFSGGGQASATQLTKDFTNVTTVAAGNDSVKLMPAATGRRMVIKNNGANTLDVYPSTGDSINALAANASHQIAAGATNDYKCISGTNWQSV